MKFFKKSLLFIITLFLVGCGAENSSVENNINPVTIDQFIFNQDEVEKTILQKNKKDNKYQYILISKEQTDIEFTIQLDNPESFGIDALRVKCDDLDAEIFIENRWEKIAYESNGTRVINWSSENPYEKTYKIRTTSLNDLNFFEVVDIRLAGNDKFLSKYTNSSNFGNSKFSIHKINADTYDLDIEYNTFDEIKFGIEVKEDKFFNFKVNGLLPDLEGNWTFNHFNSEENSYKYTIDFDYQINEQQILSGRCYEYLYPFDGEIEGVLYKNNGNTVSVVGYTDDMSKNISILDSLFGKPVTRIEENAFEGSNLLSVKIPKSIEVIEKYAFKGCKITAFYCEAESKPSNWDSLWENSYIPPYWGINESNFVENEGLQYVIVDDNAILTKCISEEKNIDVPAVIEIANQKFKVTQIAINAFSDNSSLSSIRIAENITIIGERSFDDCTSLNDIKFPFGCNVKTIGKNAFFNCSSIVDFPKMEKLEEISFGAFSKCESLQTFTMPDCILKVESLAFSNCTSLKYKVTDGMKYLGNEDNPYVVLMGAEEKSDTYYAICEGTKIIYESALSAGVNIVSLEIPKTISVFSTLEYTFPSSPNIYYKGKMEDWLNITFESAQGNPMSFANKFYMLDDNNEWKELTEIIIPEGVQVINDYQFYGFKNVTSISLPNSLLEIKSSSFISYSSSIESVYYHGSLEELESIQNFNDFYYYIKDIIQYFYVLDAQGRWSNILENF